MKKWLCVFLIAASLLSLAACGGVPTAQDVDVDLTKLSSTMVYSEVYDMTNTPENYLGKTVRMSGAFSVYEGDSRNYYACIIADAAACCEQGIEFILTDGHAYPDDYPEPGEIVTVSGVFDTYEEDGFYYCQLIDAKMEG